MGLFSSKNEGGIKDAIRCDEKDFLIWKWRPNRDAKVGSSLKENSIRSGSSLSVRPGQAAIFLYPGTDGQYDVIKGSYNDFIKTDNMPVLTGLVGTLFGGGAPFQAEVYFINQQKGMQLPFYIDFFRVIPAEPEYKAYDIRVSVKGSIAFEVSTQPEYIKYLMEAWGGNDTTLDEFEEKLRTMLTQEIKQIVANAPKDTGIFIMHFNGLIGELGQYILARLQNNIAHRFGVLATGIYISDINYDEESEGYLRLKEITEDQTHLFNIEAEKTALLKFAAERKIIATDVAARNFTTRVTAETQMAHNEDMLARMREEGQFAQHLQSEAAFHQTNLGSESAYINAHALNRQADVMQTEAISYYNTLITRIQSTEGYTADTPVVYIEDRSKNDDSFSGNKAFDPIYLPPYQGNSIINDFAWEETMELWCGFAPVKGDEEELDPKVIEGMSVYPDDGSVKMVKGTVVVKFSD